MSDEKEKYDNHSRRMKRSITGLLPMTVSVRVRTLKAFFNWCEREGYVAKSPACDILQKVDDDNVSGFTEQQVRQLLAVVDKGTFAGFRDYVIMVTLLDTGLRISELFSLTVADLDFQQLSLTCHGRKQKRGKHGQSQLRRNLQNSWLDFYVKTDFGPNADHLFNPVMGIQ